MKTAARVLMVLMAVLSVAVAQAQSNTNLKVDIPFAFSIGDKVLTSGTYFVKALDREVECWYDENGRGQIIVMTIPTKKEAFRNTNKLIFHRYGEQYYLAEVWSAGESHKVKVAPREAQLARTKQPYEIVALLMQPAH